MLNQISFYQISIKSQHLLSSFWATFSYPAPDLMFKPIFLLTNMCIHLFHTISNIEQLLPTFLEFCTFILLLSKPQPKYSAVKHFWNFHLCEVFEQQLNEFISVSYFWTCLLIWSYCHIEHTFYTLQLLNHIILQSNTFFKLPSIFILLKTFEPF